MPLPKALQDADAQADALINKNGNTDQQAAPGQQDNAADHQQGTPQQQQAAPGDDSANWEHKFKVLQGKYNSEVGTLQEKVRQLEGQATDTSKLDQMQTQFTQLQNDNSQLRQALEEKEQAQPAQLNPYLVEEYGDDFATAVADQAKQLAERMVKPMKSEYDQKLADLENRFQSTQQSVTQVSTDNRMQTLKSVLGSRNINFDMIDSDANFHNWLAQTDAYSGMQRQALLQSAFQSGDIERTARFYTDFVESQQSTQSNPLHGHVEPTGGATAPDTGSQQSQFDPNAFANLHHEMRTGKITAEEFDRREREMFAANSR